MPPRKLRIKRDYNQEHPTTVVAGDNTIITALEKVLEVAINSELSDEKLQEAKAEFDFLADKLTLNTMQAIIVAILIDYDAPMPTKRMANCLSVRNLRLLSSLNEFKELMDRRIVRRRLDCHSEEFAYFISPNASKCYIRNEVYTPPTREDLGLSEFMEMVDDTLELYDNNSLTKRELHDELLELLEKNSMLHLCKVIKGYSPCEQILFLYCCHEYVSKGDRYITNSQYRDYFIPNDWAHLSGEISMGTSVLLQNNLLEQTCGDDMIAGNVLSISIAQEYRQYLSTELGLHWERDEKIDRQPGLLQFETINPKQMFYNETEKIAINQLTDLLQQEQFTAIQERLAQHGMRKGFACLFYGSPGTGKTETALQLAKATGRDIMQVNITDVKSKWVGESEQNIKGIFDSYRKYCKRCKTLPILLFNEADAVIGTRLEHTSRSVDKMENAIQNIILEEMEKLEGILIATTNLTSNMDKAFERRFLYKVEFRKPSLEARTGIWRSMLPALMEEEATLLASDYELSGGQIENIVRKNMVDHILYNKPTTVDSLRHYCESESLQRIQAQRPVVGFR